MKLPRGTSISRQELVLFVLLGLGIWVITVAEDPPWWARVLTVGAYIIGICQWTIRIREAHMREGWK